MPRPEDRDMIRLRMLEPDRRRRCRCLPQRPVLRRRRDAQRGEAADDCRAGDVRLKPGAARSRGVFALLVRSGWLRIVTVRTQKSTVNKALFSQTQKTTERLRVRAMRERFAQLLCAQVHVASCAQVVSYRLYGHKRRLGMTSFASLDSQN